MTLSGGNTPGKKSGEIAGKACRFLAFPVFFRNFSRKRTWPATSIEVERPHLGIASGSGGAAYRLAMANDYLELISRIELLHRQLLELVKIELENLRAHDINNVQALMLFNINDAEMTIGELTLRGCYLGSNVSYNVKKMVENGYLDAERSAHDLRSIRVKLTNKGHLLRDRLVRMYGRHTEMLRQADIKDFDLQGALAALERLSRLWTMSRDRLGPLAQDPFADRSVQHRGPVSA
jgi:DNA-binding MarR family transcriptional regulator